MAQVQLRLRDVEDGNLPAVCICCGEPATTTAKKNMRWFPPWVNVLILAGLLPYAIVAAILTKKASLQAPMCAEHTGHWFNRSLLMWGTFFLFGVVGLGAILFASSLPPPQNNDIMPFICIGSAVLLVTWLIIVIAAQSTAVRPNEITDRHLTVKGVSAAFADAVEEEARERRERRRQREESGWRDEEGEDAPPPPPRRRSPTDDAIEE